MNNPSNINVLAGDWTYGVSPFLNTQSIDQLDVPVVKINMPPPISVFEDVRVITNETGIFVPESSKQEVLLDNILLELQKANEVQREIIFVEEQPVKNTLISDETIQAIKRHKRLVQNNINIQSSPSNGNKFLEEVIERRR